MFETRKRIDSVEIKDPRFGIVGWFTKTGNLTVVELNLGYQDTAKFFMKAQLQWLAEECAVRNGSKVFDRDTRYVYQSGDEELNPPCIVDVHLDEEIGFYDIQNGVIVFTFSRTYCNNRLMDGDVFSRIVKYFQRAAREIDRMI